MNIEDFLAAHPMPWKHERPGSGLCASVIRDSGAIAKDIPVASDLCPEFAEFVISLVGSYLSQAGAIAGKDADLIAATAEIGKLRAEVHGAQLAVDELRAELMAEQIEAAELHDLFAVQQELIERLQNRIKRLEARA